MKVAVPSLYDEPASNFFKNCLKNVKTVKTENDYQADLKKTQNKRNTDNRRLITALHNGGQSDTCILLNTLFLKSIRTSRLDAQCETGQCSEWRYKQTEKNLAMSPQTAPT